MSSLLSSSLSLMWKTAFLLRRGSWPRPANAPGPRSSEKLEEERVRRMVEDRGMTAADARARIAAQATDAERAAVATTVLVNDGTPQRLRERVDAWWDAEVAPRRRTPA